VIFQDFPGPGIFRDIAGLCRMRGNHGVVKLIGQRLVRTGTIDICCCVRFGNTLDSLH